MIELKDLDKLSNNFAKFISKSYHEAGISIEAINEKITYSDYFDFLEKDELSIFLDKDIDAIIKEIFGPVHFYERVNDIGNLYWAGKQYISIFLNCSLPLRTIFLLLPLEEMVSYYDTYHELGRVQLINLFKTKIQTKRSILKTIRKEKDLAVRELSLLTRIPEQTIKYYESDNRLLYKAPFNSLIKIADSLSCSLSFFKKESDFVPLTNGILNNDRLLDGVSFDLEKYLMINGLLLERITYESDNLEQPCLCIGNPSFVLIYENTQKYRKIIIPDYVLKCILKNRIHEIAEDYCNDQLLF